MNWSEVVERYISEGRTVSGGKGDSTANQTEATQGVFTQQLQNAFTSNNAAQQNQLNFLNQKLQSAIANPQGYSPSTLAAMRAQANDSVAAENQNVERNVNSSFAAKGGAEALPSGVQAQINAGVGEAAAQAGNAAQQNITEQNANLQNQNQQNAIQQEMGVAGLENPEGMASSENQAAGTVSNLSQAVTAANGPGIGSILGSVAGSALGAAAKF